MMAPSHGLDPDLAQVTQPLALAPRGLHCGVCGSHEVVIDYIDSSFRSPFDSSFDTRFDESLDGAAALELGECQHCAHRWTRSLATCGDAEAGARVHAVPDLKPLAESSQHRGNEALPHAA